MKEKQLLMKLTVEVKTHQRIWTLSNVTVVLKESHTNLIPKLTTVTQALIILTHQL